jgi:hypothetical protein
VGGNGDETERPISMTSTNASEGSCYSTVTLISPPPSPQSRVSPTLPTLAPCIPQAPSLPSLAHLPTLPTTIVDNTPNRTSRLSASSSFPPPTVQNHDSSHMFDGWKDAPPPCLELLHHPTTSSSFPSSAFTLSSFPPSSFPPSSSLPLVTPSLNSMPRLGLPHLAAVPQHQPTPVPVPLPRTKSIVTLHMYPSSSKT